MFLRDLAAGLEGQPSERFGHIDLVDDDDLAPIDKCTVESKAIDAVRRASAFMPEEAATECGCIADTSEGLDGQTECFDILVHQHEIDTLTLTSRHLIFNGRRLAISQNSSRRKTLSARRPPSTAVPAQLGIWPPTPMLIVDLCTVRPTMVVKDPAPIVAIFVPSKTLL